MDVAGSVTLTTRNTILVSGLVKINSRLTDWQLKNYLYTMAQPIFIDDKTIKFEPAEIGTADAGVWTAFPAHAEYHATWVATRNLGYEFTANWSRAIFNGTRHYNGLYNNMITRVFDNATINRIRQRITGKANLIED